MNKSNKQKTNTEITTVSQSFSITHMNTEGVGDALKENLGGAGLTSFDLDRVSFPTGGNTTWNLTDSLTGEEMQEKEIIGILIHQQSTRAYWPGDFSGDRRVGGGDSGGKYHWPGLPYPAFYQ